MTSCRKTLEVKSKTMVAFLPFTDLGLTVHFSPFTFHHDRLGDWASCR